jgi:hypothetical protein
MIGTLFSIVIIAFYEHGTKSEKLDVFKTLYLIMVIFSIIIIILVKTSQTGYEFTTNGIIYLIIYIMFLTFFQISIDREHFTKDEITLINKNHNYKIIRLFLRLSIIFFMGIVIMFPTFLILNFLPVRTDLTLEINQFFMELANTPTNLIRWEIMFLIIFSTITPYLLIFIAYSRWNPYDLTYAQWISILTVIDPIGSILFGVLFGIEVFPLLYLSIILFLLGASIFLRYAHESKNLVNAYIILEYKSGMMENLELKLLKLEGVYCVESLLGTYDVLLKVKTNSIKNIYYLKNTGIKSIEGIKPDSIKILFVDKILKITE